MIRSVYPQEVDAIVYIHPRYSSNNLAKANEKQLNVLLNKTCITTTSQSKTYIDIEKYSHDSMKANLLAQENFLKQSKFNNIF